MARARAPGNATHPEAAESGADVGRPVASEHQQDMGRDEGAQPHKRQIPHASRLRVSMCKPPGGPSKLITRVLAPTM